MDRSLLLPESYIFDDYTIMDQINQSRIDLEDGLPQDIIQSFLNEQVLTYLEKDLPNPIAKSIFSLIDFALTRYPDLFLPTIDIISEKSTYNSNFIIIYSILVSKISDLTHLPKCEDYINFAKDALNQLIPQIKTCEKTSCKLFGHDIPNHFLSELIFDLLKITGLNNEFVQAFFPFLFSTKFKHDYFTVSDIISIAIENDLSSNFDQETVNFICLKINRFKKFFSIQNVIDLLPKLTPKNFKLVFSIIDAIIFKSEAELSKEFAIDYLSKCRENKRITKSAEKLLKKIDIDQITTETWDYLRQCRFKLPYEIVLNLIGKLDTNYIVKLIPSLKFCDKPPFDELILKCDDFKSYDNLFYSKEVNDYSHLLKQNFWNHIMNLASQKKCHNSTVFKFAGLLKSLNDEALIHKIIKEMIFSSLPLNKKSISFLRKLSVKLYRMKFNVFDQTLVDELFEYNKQNGIVMPLPNFWKLIPQKFIYEKYMKNQSPLLKCGLIFSDEDKFLYYPTSNEITIVDQTKESLNNVSEFIKQDSLNYIVNMDEKALSLISCAFELNTANNTIHGLTPENILLFFATALKYKSKKKEFKTILEIAPSICNCYDIADKNSPHFQTSIECILSTYLDFYHQKNDINIFCSIQPMINSLTSLLLNNHYKYDKNLLLRIVFEFSRFSNKIGNYFKLFGNDLFDYIMENVSEIVKIKDLKKHSFDLNLFDQKKVNQSFINNVENSSPQKAIDSIFFMLKICKIPEILDILSPSSIKFTNYEFFSKCVKESIEKENWDNIILLEKFRQKFDFNEPIPPLFEEKSIPFEIKIKIIPCHFDSNEIDIDRFLSLILSEESPEKYFKSLFRYMMNEESTAIIYLTCMLIQVKEEEEFNIVKFILSCFSNEYKSYQNEFIKAFSQLFVLDNESKAFTKVFDFHELPITESKLGLSIISKLFNEIKNNKENCLNAICYLMGIASSFPFLFVDKFQQIIDVIFPIFDDLPLFYSIRKGDDISSIKNKKEIKNRMKILVNSISFLYSVLYSTHIFDEFVTWFFNNYSNLDEWRILTFISILCLLRLSTDPKFLIFFKRNNIIENCQIILDKYECNDQIKNEVIKFLEQYFLTYCEAPDYIKLFSEVTKNDPNHCYNLFDQVLIHFNFEDINDHLSIFKYDINSDQILIDKFNPHGFHIHHTGKKHKNVFYESLMRYSKKINRKYKKVSSFYIYHNYHDIYTITQNHIDSFIDCFEKKISSKKSKLTNQFEYPDTPDISSVKLMQVLAYEPKWIIDYFYLRKDLVFNQTQLDDILRVFEEIQKIKNDDEEDEEEITIEEINEYQHKIYQVFIDQYVLANTNIIMDSFIKLQYITEFLDALYQSKYLYYNPEFIYDLKLLIYSLEDFISDKNQTKDDELLLICLNKLLNVICLPEYATNISITQKCISIFDMIEAKNIPIRVTHLLSYALVYNPFFHNGFDEILRIASKIEYDKLGSFLPLLEQIYDEAVEKSDTKVLSLFIKNFPDISKTRQGTLFSLTQKIFTKCKDCKFIQIDDIDLLASLVGSIAPRRKKFNSKLLTDSTMYDAQSSIYKQSKILRPIPEYFIQGSAFWKFLSDNYDILGRIYEQIGSSTEFYEKFEFLLDYPEIVDFDTRSSYFHNNIQKRFSQYIGYQNINIERSNIIQSSFDQLKTPLQFYFYIIKVNFVNENGIDAGGLFREWLTLLIKELFDPKNKLFELTENECYYPSRNCKNDDLKYIRFAGKMVAYALINNICVDAHLAPFFLKKVLHHELKFIDVKGYSESNYNSYLYMMDNDVDDLDIYFVAGFNDENNQYKEVELIPNGSNIKVTNQNKNEYIDKIYSFYLIDSIKIQSKQFCEGFDSIIPHNYLRIFSPAELELLICGLPEIDIEDMKRNIILSHYTMDSPTIQCFFSAISKWDKEQLAGLLQFITGNSKVPINGFKDKRIAIYYSGETNHLPQGRTCSKVLVLPDYQNEEVLNKKLLQAINECGTFGFG